jgi:uncharacterized protein
MLLFPTELRPSPIHGVGVFLLAPVKKGEVIWRFDARVDHVYTTPELEALPATTRDFIKIHGFWHKGTDQWVLCGDNAKYYNHSENPTTLSVGRAFSDDVAAYDLPAGTELTNNYHDFYDNTDTVEKMGLR